jgi:hypothetical protein
MATKQKVECEYCSRMVLPTSLSSHHKTKVCQTAQATGMKFEPNKPDYVLQAYKANNKTKREKLIAEIGLEAVREREKIAKQKLRAALKTNEEKDDAEYEVPEAVAKHPKASKDIKKLMKSIDSQKNVILDAVKSNNKQIIPSLCKNMEEKTATKIKEGISNINKIKTREQFLQQFIQASGIKNNNTAKQYVDQFYKFSVKFTDENPNFSDLNWLNNYEDVFKFIQRDKKKNGEPYSDASKRTLLTSLGAISSVLGVDFYKVSEKYNALAKTASKALKTKQQDNVMNEKQKAKSITWEKLLALEPLFEADNGGNPFTRAIFSFYTQIPPRRTQDYRVMKVKIKNNKKHTINVSNLDTKYNWLLLSENMLPTRIVFNTFKTSSKKGYGQYIIDKIPNKLANVLKEYVVDSDLKNDNYLFHQENDKNKKYGQGNFSTLISKKIFELYTGQKIDINSIRHSYASHILKKNISQSEKAKIALSMGTSVSELDNTYKKIDLDDGY